MFEVLSDDLVKLMPLAAPGLNRFDLKTFIKEESPWSDHHELLKEIFHREMGVVMDRLQESLGVEYSEWKWGDLHQIHAV